MINFQDEKTNFDEKNRGLNSKTDKDRNLSAFSYGGVS